MNQSRNGDGYGSYFNNNCDTGRGSKDFGYYCDNEKNCGQNISRVSKEKQELFKQ